MRRSLSIAVLALTLGTGCPSIHREAAGVYVEEPWVDIGTFTRVGGRAPWVFASSSRWWGEALPIWVTPETDIVLNGAHIGLNDVEPGQEVRVLYNLRADGSNVAERIDVLGAPTPGTSPDTDS